MKRDLWTLDEVAESWGVSQRTVRRLMDSGDLPVVMLGRQVRVRRTDAAAYLKTHLRPVTPQGGVQVVRPDADGPRA